MPYFLIDIRRGNPKRENALLKANHIQDARAFCKDMGWAMLEEIQSVFELDKHSLDRMDELRRLDRENKLRGVQIGTDMERAKEEMRRKLLPEHASDRS